MGGDWGKEQPDEKNTSPVSIIRGTDINDLRTGSELRLPQRYIPENSLRQRQLRSGDVVVENSVNASSRSVGTSLLITDGVLRRIEQQAISASFCKTFRAREPQLGPLIHLHLRYLRDIHRMQYYQHVVTNGIANFQAMRLVDSEALMLPIDPELRSNLAGRIAAFVSSTFADQISVLRRTRKLLLPDLI